MQTSNEKQPLRPAQEQARPGLENLMEPKPLTEPAPATEAPSQKLKNKVAVITGGDSGIGKAVALLFAKEGADIAIIYLNEHEDAEETKRIIESEYFRKCILFPTDISVDNNCKTVMEQISHYWPQIDILVNNAAIHFESKSLEDISTEQLIKTFSTNIFSYFWITKYALPSMPKGSSIINTSSVVAYRGSSSLIDYAATKGAIVSFTRSLSSNLIEKGIRVNGVAPGPIWTPLIPSSFEADKASEHGSDVPMKRAGEPVEVAPSFLFLASSDSSYITGQFIHPNGGEIING